jgi:hypothetical protein
MQSADQQGSASCNEGAIIMNLRRAFNGNVRRIVTAAGLCGLAALGAAATAPAAAADSSEFHPLISNMSWLDVGVRGGSTVNGTDIIQWTADNLDDQRWVDFEYTNTDASWVHRLRNLGSEKCLTTDGVPGHPVFQQDCSPSNPYQAWLASYQWWAAGNTLYNPASGLNLDVQGASYGRGAEINVWYPNGGLNQVFSMPGGDI